jgi:uncharacterized protein (TIRG00374 family)
MIKKKSVVFIIKIAVSILLFSYIISKIDWDQALTNLERANYLILIFVFFLFFLERVEYTYKLNLLIWVRGINVRFWRLFLINSIGAFWGLFLPSSLSADVVKSFYLIRNNSEKSVSISSILLDRILGVLVMLLLCLISLIVGGHLVSTLNIEYYIIIILITFLLFLYLFQKEKTTFFLHKLLLKVK